MDNFKRISEIVESKKELFTDVSDKIWGYAETRFEEYKSADLLCKTLENEGFTVQRKVGGMETAFIGSFGHGKPVIAILGEYDALSGLSQIEGVTYEKPVIAGGAGHGCGHHLLGAGALAAAVSLRYYMAENNLSGTVRYYGCPGEEGGCGKTFMVREGLFDDVDCALTWHPGADNWVIHISMLAILGIYYRFKGRSSHASAFPHMGRSALDAVELMNVGVNFLREHVIPEARMHYAITNPGGKMPNVVQSEAEEYFYIRAPKISQAREIYERVCDIARGAALMTGTEVEIVVESGISNLIPNKTLASLLHKNLTGLGIPDYDDNDLQLARNINNILTEEEKKSIPKAFRDKVIADVIDPLPEVESIWMGSTDVSDVSWVVPTAQCMISCTAAGTPPHSWKMVTQGKTSIAHKGMLYAAKALAATAIDLLENHEIVANAKAELKERLDGEKYICPIPEDITPSMVSRG